MTAETLSPLDLALSCPTCSRHTCRCGDDEDRWGDVRSTLAPWSEAVAANA